MQSWEQLWLIYLFEIKTIFLDFWLFSIWRINDRNSFFCVTATLLLTCMEARKMKSGMLRRTIIYTDTLLNTYMAHSVDGSNIKGIGKRLYTAVFSFLLNRSSWLLLISACICGHDGVYWGMCNSTKHCSICIYFYFKISLQSVTERLNV